MIFLSMVSKRSRQGPTEQVTVADVPVNVSVNVPVNEVSDKTGHWEVVE